LEGPGTVPGASGSLNRNALALAPGLQRTRQPLKREWNNTDYTLSVPSPRYLVKVIKFGTVRTVRSTLPSAGRSVGQRAALQETQGQQAELFQYEKKQKAKQFTSHFDILMEMHK